MRPSLFPALLAALALSAGCSGAGKGGGGADDDDDDGGFSNPGPVGVPQPSELPHEPLPDLTVNEPLLNTSWFVQEIDADSPMYECAVVEGCLAGTGMRKVLRFSVGVANVGATDLVVGDPADSPEDFEFARCHGHYHYKDFATYTLSAPGGEGVAFGRKQAFCLMDIEEYSQSAPPGGGQFDCGNQGISQGWQDIYESYLDCQWIDVTGIGPGDYELTVTVNADHKIAEAGPAPNTVTIPLTLTAQDLD